MKTTKRDLLAAFGLGMSGMAFSALSLWARFADYITSPLRLLQWIGLLAAGCLSALLVGVWRRAQLWPVAASLMIGGLVFGNVGPLTGPLGAAGALALWVAMVVVLLVLLTRLDSTIIRALVFGLSVYLVGEPAVQFVANHDAAAPILASTQVKFGVGDHPSGSDFVLLVLDGYSSIQTMESDFADGTDDIAGFLRQRGFGVSEVAWAPATRSVVSIAGLLDGRSLAVDREPSESDLKRMYQVIQGEGRLFRAFAEAGYASTYVESGWLGSVCGPSIENCVRRPFVDEAIQELLADSILAPWWEGTGGHAFARGGLHSLTEVEETLGELAQNNRPDFVFSHVLLPHGPYALDERCQVTGEVISDPPPGTELTPRNSSPAEAGYLQHVRCVNSHLRVMAEAIGPEMSLAILGDHGSTLRGQMFTPPSTWSPDEVRERGTVFLATKYPAACSRTGDSRSSLAAIQGLVECLLDPGFDFIRDDKVWLYAFEGPPRCVTPTEETEVVDVAC